MTVKVNDTHVLSSVGVSADVVKPTLSEKLCSEVKSCTMGLNPSSVSVGAGPHSQPCQSRVFFSVLSTSSSLSSLSSSSSAVIITCCVSMCFCSVLTPEAVSGSQNLPKGIMGAEVIVFSVAKLHVEIILFIVAKHVAHFQLY